MVAIKDGVPGALSAWIAAYTEDLKEANGAEAPDAFFDTTYGNFAGQLQAQVRREAFGEDIGQTSWLTADELRRFLAQLDIGAGSAVLDVACGSGGPALFIARTTGARVVGIDANANGIATAEAQAQAQGLQELAQFRQADASRPLPFPDESFDAILCIDAINHFPGRLQVMREWRRVLRKGGRVIFTDPITVTGQLSNEEIALRSSIGFFLFTPLGLDARLMKEAGFEILSAEDGTENMELVSQRWQQARARYRDALIQVEGEATYEAQQRFFGAVYTLASERRLSRFAFLGLKRA